MDEQQAKILVAGAGRMLLSEGLVARTWGNVSCRVDADRFAITPSGLSYEAMTANDVVICRISDGTYTGCRKPSSEKGVHAAAYTCFPKTDFVIHTHQTYASALGVAGFDTLTLSEADTHALGGVAIASYGLPGTKRLTANVKKALLSGAETVLMAHHGALLLGRTCEEAFARAKLLEAVCRSACSGQFGDDRQDSSALKKLAADVGACLGTVACTAHPAVLKASHFAPIRAQLDDMAQMVGAKLTAAAPDKFALQRALNRYGAVLVPGLGALVSAESAGDAEALKLLTEKSCIVFLNSHARGVASALSPVDANLMRLVYLKKYAKKIGR